MSTPLRILVVAPSLAKVGGQSVQAARHVAALEDEPALSVSFLATDTLLPRPLGSIRFVRTIARLPVYVTALLVRARRADLLHVFAASYWSFLLGPTPAIAVAKLLGKKVVVNYHSGEGPDHLSRSPTAVRILRRSDAIVVQSAFLEQAFASFNLDSTVIPNHLDVDRLHYRRRRLLQPRFLSMRALEPDYGVDTVLRAFAIVQRHVPEAELRVVGEGSQRRKLEALARTLGLRATLFSGAVDHERIVEVYDAADILLNASRVDSMPLTLLEAFAAGVCVVSTAAGGIPYIASHEETALLVAVGDADALADAAIRLLREPELAVRLADAARATSASSTWAVTGPAWRKLYADLAGDAG